ncbi:Rv3235 family protein [Streptomyces sp. NPDC059866]|uniref:Rv3235 family protein n=1 Tax=Streptomyces sp. NPDC059866 TaxID=3346978 RepID=UPI00365B4631
MNKVMTRTPQHPGTRPPTRRDTRRPGSNPPRTPGAGPSRTSPAATRPATTSTTTPTAARSATTPPAAARPATPSTPSPAAQHPLTAPAPSPAAPRPLRTPSTPQAPAPPRSASHTRRPVVPQPRPTDLFADRLLLVLSGQRPVHAMLRHTAGPAYDELARLAERGPLRTRGPRPVVRDVGYYEPRPGAIEAFARIGAGDRLRAMAFRLELGRDHRWRCTAVELGGPRTRTAVGD